MKRCVKRFPPTLERGDDTVWLIVVVVFCVRYLLLFIVSFFFFVCSSLLYTYTCVYYAQSDRVSGDLSLVCPLALSNGLREGAERVEDRGSSPSSYASASRAPDPRGPPAPKLPN